MWQKAKIIDTDFYPARYIGREIWVEGRPSKRAIPVLAIEGEGENVRPYANKDSLVYDQEWFLTNLGFISGQRVSIFRGSVELIAEFAESVPLVDLNTGEKLRTRCA